MGETVASRGGSDGNILLWDPYNGQSFSDPLHAHPSAVLAAAAFSVRNRGSVLISVRT